MIHSVLISTDHQSPALEMIKLQGYKNLEDFSHAKQYYSNYDNGASHYLIKIDVLLYKKLSGMTESKQLEHMNSIDWNKSNKTENNQDELPF